MNMNNNNEQEVLQDWLREDTGEDALLETFERWRAEEFAPDPAKQAAMIAQMEGMVVPASKRQHIFGLLPFLIIQAQLKIVRGAIFVASALVMVIGVAVTLALYNPKAEVGDLPLVLIAPLVTAFGLAFLYNSEVDAAMEIEQTTPVSPALVMLARITLVFGFDLIAGLIGSAIIALTQPDISLWPLVVAWLAPMAFLSAMAFLLSVFFLDSAVGIIASLVLWGLFIANRYIENKPLFLRLPDLLAPELRPLFLIAAIPLFILALWLCEQRELQFRRGE